MAGGDGAKCKHSSALFKWINEVSPTISKSKTDKPKEWGLPSKYMSTVYPRGEHILKLFGGRGVSHDYLATKEKMDFMKLLCEETNNQVGLLFIKTF